MNYYLIIQKIINQMSHLRKVRLVYQLNKKDAPQWKNSLELLQKILKMHKLLLMAMCICTVISITMSMNVCFVVYVKLLKMDPNQLQDNPRMKRSPQSHNLRCLLHLLLIFTTLMKKGKLKNLIGRRNGGQKKDLFYIQRKMIFKVMLIL